MTLRRSKRKKSEDPIKLPKLELNWIGKHEKLKVEPRILIKKDKYTYKHSHEKGTKKSFDNLLIYGDNLLALKALERDYTGKIKCIYIDPPYNTGSAFQHYDDGLEHSEWLNLMKPRLEILKNLLSEDGSIWISIDADENHYLKVLCDEVFGRINFIDEVVWERTYAPINLKKTLSRCHEYILAYAKNKKGFELKKLPRSINSNARYQNPDNDSRGPWTSGPLQVGPVVHEKVYPITTPSGRVLFPPENCCWRLSKKRLSEYIDSNRIWFGKDGNNVPRIKRFLSEVKDGITSMTLWKREEVGDTQEAKREVKSFNLKDVFPTPKPERLIQRIIHLATNPGDIVLDSFAGSGTTGAVAHKMGRRWIMIELGKHCHTHIYPRMKKVIEGDDEGGITKDVNWKGGGGFRYAELAPSLLQKDEFGNYIINKSYDPNHLAEAVCSIEGYKFCPSSDCYWMHGKSSENHYIYVTTQYMTRAKLASLSEEVGENRSLVVYCSAFRIDPNEFENLEVRKIPKSILNQCEWDKNDYSFNLSELPTALAIKKNIRTKRKPRRKVKK